MSKKNRLPKKTNAMKKTGVSGILGIGLDGEDGQKRITRSEQMVLIGGSEETHGKMQDTAIYFAEKLEKKGKNLSQVSPQEAMEILHEAREKAK
jgi:hypothetical protein